MRPTKGIFNLENFKVMFIWLFLLSFFFLIYGKCKKLNASVSLHRSHAKISCFLYAQQFFGATFCHVITAQMAATVPNIVIKMLFIMKIYLYITGLSLKKTVNVYLPHAKATFYCYGVQF